MKLPQAIYWFFRDASPKAQHTRQFVKIFILVGLFVALFWIIPIQQVFRALATADLEYFLLGIGVLIPTFALKAWQLKILVQHQGIQRTTGQILLINFAAKFLFLVAPTTLVGSGSRWYRLSQPEGKTAEALVALAFFRSLETSITILVGLGFYIFRMQTSSWAIVGLILAFIGACVLIFFFLIRVGAPISRRVQARFSDLTPRPALSGLLRTLENFFSALAAYSKMPIWELLGVILAGVVFELMTLFSDWVLARSVNINLSFMNLGWVHAIVILAVQLPFVIAGGLGIREVSLVALLSTFGIATDLALAFSFLLTVRNILFSLLGGLLDFFDTLYSRLRPAQKNIEDQKQ